MEWSARKRKGQSTETDKMQYNRTAQISVADNRGNRGSTASAPMKRTSTFGRLLELDVALTNKLALCANKDSPYGHLRPVMQILEYSCHGIPWLIFPVVAILMTHQIHDHQKLMNLYLGLWLDLLVSLILKISVRRQRPAHNINDMFGTVSVDCYSFPSGHSTRAGMLACILTMHFSLGTLGSCFCVLWLMLVAASRVVLGRHHVLDVACGLLIGLLQYCVLLKWLWLSEETCEAIILPVQEELHL